MQEIGKTIEYVAFHESGHILLAYLEGDAVLRAEIQIEEGQFKHAETEYTEDASTTLKEYEFTLLFGYGGLPEQQKQLVLSHWHKVLSRSLGGPIAEAYYASGMNHACNLEIALVGGDGKFVDYCNKNLIKHDPDYNENSLDRRIEEITESVKQHWGIVEDLSKFLCESKIFSIDQTTIENILEKHGLIRR